MKFVDYKIDKVRKISKLFVPYCEITFLVDLTGKVYLGANFDNDNIKYYHLDWLSNVMDLSFSIKDRLLVSLLVIVDSRVFEFEIDLATMRYRDLTKAAAEQKK